MTMTPQLQQPISIERIFRALAFALLWALARLALVATAAACLVVLLLHEIAAALVYTIAVLLSWLSF